MGQGVSLLGLSRNTEFMPLRRVVILNHTVIAVGLALCLTRCDEDVEEWLLFLTFSVLYAIWISLVAPAEPESSTELLLFLGI